MQTDDKVIVEAVKRDPEQGFRLLMARYEEPIYWHIRRMVVTHADAQDTTQEAFVRAFRSFSMYRGDSSLRVWLYRIATNEALRTLDKRKKERERDGGDEALAANAMADSYIDYDDEVAVKFQAAIKTLPPKQQMAFNLRYYDELAYDEIATLIGSSAASAKVNYNLAKDKIIKYMNSND